MKKKTINVQNIVSAEGMVYNDGDNVLIIETPKHKVKIHLDANDIGYVAEKLWRIIEKQQERLDYNRKCLKGGAE